MFIPEDNYKRSSRTHLMPGDHIAYSKEEGGIDLVRDGTAITYMSKALLDEEGDQLESLCILLADMSIYDIEAVPYDLGDEYVRYRFVFKDTPPESP